MDKQLAVVLVTPARTVLATRTWEPWSNCDSGSSKRQAVCSIGNGTLSKSIRRLRVGDLISARRLCFS